MSEVKINRLDSKEKMRVREYLLNNREKITTERPGYQELATEVSEKLKLTIGPKTLKEIAGMSGIEWEPKILTGRQASEKAHHRLDEHERAITALEDSLGDFIRGGNEVTKQFDTCLSDLVKQVTELRRALNHLYTQLNATPPAGYIVPQQAMDSARRTSVLNPNGK